MSSLFITMTIDDTTLFDEIVSVSEIRCHSAFAGSS